MNIETVERTSSEELQMELVAKRVCQTLANHYPNHLWMVGWHPGQNIVIKNMAISSQIGRVIHYPDCHNEHDLERKAMQAGGALLELANLPRGAWNGDLITKLDGKDPLAYHESLRKLG